MCAPLTSHSCAQIYPTSVDEYTYDGQSGFTELTASLAAGMTPTFSYWCSDDMLWMDGAGQDGLGPCPNAPEDGSKCGDTVSFYDFKITGGDVTTDDTGSDDTAPSGSCGVESDTDYSGNDLGNVAGSSADECCGEFLSGSSNT